MHKRNQNTWLFIGFILLAGLIHIFEDPHHAPDPSVRAAMFCTTFLIYAGLLLFWIRSVHTRLLPSKARTYMILSALMMLLYLMIRGFKYRIAGTPVLLRLAWYAYYLPNTLIPALFLMVCIRIRCGEDIRRWDEKLLLLPAGILSALVLTNDLHRLIFQPDPGITVLIGQTGTYTYGTMFYAIYLWMILALAAGMCLLVKETGARRSAWQTIPLLAPVLLWILLIAVLNLCVRYNIHPPYEVPEIHIFCLLAVFEICIRVRLIPCNENYAGLFDSLRMPILITDRKFCPVYASAGEVRADQNTLERALQEPVYLTPDEKLSGREIRGGYTFWVSDESGVHRAIEELLEANELLDSENTLFSYLIGNSVEFPMR